MCRNRLRSALTGLTPVVAIVVLLLSSREAPIAGSDAAGAGAHRFVNGRWFDGESFESGTLYSVDGVLRQEAPAGHVRTIDLAGGYVVPPFGDAHTHLFDSAYHLGPVLERYLERGIFYAKEANNSIAGRDAVAGKVNLPTSVDVSYANGGLTTKFGHPMVLYEALQLGLYTPQAQRAAADRLRQKNEMENDGYFVVESEEDLATKWDSILAGRPDFLKIYLLRSERFQETRNDPEHFGRRGLDPALVPEVIDRAHAAGLRVAAHVETGSDFGVAIRAGVDEFAHLPGYGLRRLAPDEESVYTIREEDARLAGERAVVAVPTYSLAQRWRGDEVDLAKGQAVQAANLKLLKAHGVRIAVGSDSNAGSFRSGADALEEAMYLRGLGVFTDRELLRAWVETTPQAIFPGRKIGRLVEGYEASFLVLKGNPLEDFGQVKAITLRVKQGLVLRGGDFDF